MCTQTLPTGLNCFFEICQGFIIYYQSCREICVFTFNLTYRSPFGFNIVALFGQLGQSLSYLKLYRFADSKHQVGIICERKTIGPKESIVSESWYLLDDRQWKGNSALDIREQPFVGR